MKATVAACVGVERPVKANRAAGAGKVRRELTVDHDGRVVNVHEASKVKLSV
jgi:hypothetical protein